MSDQGASSPQLKTVSSPQFKTTILCLKERHMYVLTKIQVKYSKVLASYGHDLSFLTALLHHNLTNQYILINLSRSVLEAFH